MAPYGAPGVASDNRREYRRREAGFATFAILIVGQGIGACSTLW